MLSVPQVKRRAELSIVGTVPVLIAIPYFLIEALAFWGVARWLGVGWALILLFLFFFGGLFLAATEMRRIACEHHRVKPRLGLSQAMMACLRLEHCAWRCQALSPRFLVCC